MTPIAQIGLTIVPRRGAGASVSTMQGSVKPPSRDVFWAAKGILFARSDPNPARIVQHMRRVDKFM